MTDAPDSGFHWYYVGHYGQLGPLSLDQVQDLVRDGVIERDTLVWRTGMVEWIRAGIAPDLDKTFIQYQAVTPPPVPMAMPPTHQAASAPRIDSLTGPSAPYPPMNPAPWNANPLQSLPMSDKSRVAAGLLQLFIPGTGRMYLGFMAVGVLQFLTFFCFGFGWFWSIIDGVLLLTGSVKLDGYGRRIAE